MTMATLSYDIKRSPTVKTSAIVRRIQVLLDRFGTLEKSQQKYGDLVEADKSFLLSSAKSY